MDLETFLIQNQATAVPGQQTMANTTQATNGSVR